MNVPKINNYNNYRYLNFGNIKQKPTYDSKVVKDSENLKYAVTESVRRWNIDLPIPGVARHGAGNSINLMLNHEGDTIFAHVDKYNRVDRIITVADDGEKSVTDTYVFDKKTQELKDYKKENND